MPSDERRLDEELTLLRRSAKETFLRDLQFTDDHARRIMQHALRHPLPSRTQARSRSQKTWLSALAGLAAAALVCVIGLPILHKQLSPSASGSMDDWSTGFSSIPQQQLIDQFQNVTQITFSEGRFANPSTPSARVTLTGAEQRELFQIMKTTRERTDGVTPEPLTLEWNISFFSPKNSMEGSYRGDGAMILPGDVTAGQTHAVAVAPNPRLVQFVNRVVVPTYKSVLLGRERIMAKRADQAAYLFMRDIHNPTQAYRYCFSDVMLNDGLTFRKLAAESQTYNFGSYHIANVVHYLYGGSAALITLQSSQSNAAPPVTLRVLKVGEGWLISEIGRTLVADQVTGNPLSLSEPFGSHTVLVIGPTSPPSDTLTRVKRIPLDDSADAWYRSADVIVYQRPGISGKAHVQLPGKFSMGHPDPRAVKQLQNSTSFQRALSEAKHRHIPLIVYGNSDHLLNEWFMKSVLHDLSGGFSISSGGSDYVVIRYQPDGSIVYSDGRYASGPNSDQIPAAQIIGDALSSVELSLDMGS